MRFPRVLLFAQLGRNRDQGVERGQVHRRNLVLDCVVNVRRRVGIFHAGLHRVANTPARASSAWGSHQRRREPTIRGAETGSRIRLMRFIRIHSVTYVYVGGWLKK